MEHFGWALGRELMHFLRAKGTCGNVKLACVGSQVEDGVRH